MDKNTDTARQEADEVREVTIEEARALPGLLGRIATAMLTANGWYSAVLDGRKVLFVKKA